MGNTCSSIFDEEDFNPDDHHRSKGSKKKAQQQKQLAKKRKGSAATSTAPSSPVPNGKGAAGRGFSRGESGPTSPAIGGSGSGRRHVEERRDSAGSEVIKNDHPPMQSSRPPTAGGSSSATHHKNDAKTTTLSLGGLYYGDDFRAGSGTKGDVTPFRNSDSSRAGNMSENISLAATVLTTGVTAAVSPGSRDPSLGGGADDDDYVTGPASSVKQQRKKKKKIGGAMVTAKSSLGGNLSTTSTNASVGLGGGGGGGFKSIFEQHRSATSAPDDGLHYHYQGSAASNPLAAPPATVVTSRQHGSSSKGGPRGIEALVLDSSAEGEDYGTGSANNAASSGQPSPRLFMPTASSVVVSPSSKNAAALRMRTRSADRADGAVSPPPTAEDFVRVGGQHPNRRESGTSTFADDSSRNLSSGSASRDSFGTRHHGTPPMLMELPRLDSLSSRDAQNAPVRIPKKWKR